MVNYNIVKDYDWTSVPRNSPLRDETPCANILAYELDNSQLMQFVNGYLNMIQLKETEDAQGGKSVEFGSKGDPGLAFYRNLYKSDKKLGNFTFPYFSADVRGFSNEFSDSFSNISQRGAKMIGAEEIENLGGAGEKLIGGGIALGQTVLPVGGTLVENLVGAAKGASTVVKNIFSGESPVDKGMIMEGLQGFKAKMAGTQTMGAPGNFIETPKFYQYGHTDQGIAVSFVLANTLNDDALVKNAEFIKYFTKINRPTRKGAMGMTFPAIYHIEIPGVRYIEWASLESFNLSLLGQRRKIDGVIIPEAYQLTMEFTSLTLEPANFMDVVQTPDQSGEQYARDRAEALGELRAQAGTAPSLTPEQKKPFTAEEYTRASDRVDEQYGSMAGIPGGSLARENLIADSIARERGIPLE